MLRIFGERDGHEHHVLGTGESSCFYDSPSDLTDFINSLFSQGKRIEARTARIEVSDQEGALHAHDGFTFGIVLAGSGYIRTKSGKLPVGPGDRFSFGPGDPHLSVADSGRTLVEIIVFIGEAGNRQDLVEIE